MGFQIWVYRRFQGGSTVQLSHFAFQGINEFDDNTDKVISELETKLSAIEIDMQNGAM